MKWKIIIFVLIVFIISGCGQDEVARKVSEDIEAIGKVHLEDEGKIAKIEGVYRDMTDKQKNQVKNYRTFLEAKDTIEILKEEEDVRIEQERLYLEKEKQELLNSRPYKYAVMLVESIRDSLKDDNSLKLKLVEYVEFESENKQHVILNIDYSGIAGIGIKKVNSIYAEYVDGKLKNSAEKLVDEDKYSSYHDASFSKNSEEIIQNLDVQLILANLKQ